MLTLILRAIIIYIIVLISVRIMGKRQIGDMQPFELVATLIIADLACIPMSDVSIPIFYGVVPLLSLVVLHHLFTLLNRKSVFFRKLFNGKPLIVINKDGIDYDALKSLNMTLNDLTEGLRGAGCFNISDVAYAIVETNGNISVLQKAQTLPPTNESMGIKQEESSLNVILINDGKIMKDNLDYLGIEKEDFESFLKKQGIEKVSDILIFSINENNQGYIQKKYQPGQVVDTKLLGEKK